ncbi:sulfotransferase family 2 domain-containing protein [Vreelandella janggokensis]|uniref:sulfotransferase family 2 domain-containing protein n=1 Tax=Vreelandella janggokensis TaxID=370767 RepID=UPI0028676B63|nr:sulfotransferase family 2 domain-containing protein [Halomonas janggokensis]MDR5886698.1 sulfotransferase family 2 domain-containing protein [Halomonas janggokensis]
MLDLVGLKNKLFPLVSVNSRMPFKESIQCCNSTCGCRVSNFLWISKTLSVIYVETPKCGCSSVKNLFEINASPEIVQEAYLRSYINLTNSGDQPFLSYDGFGNSFSLASYRENKKEILSRIVDGSTESREIGKFGFVHSFDTLANVLASYPNYMVFCVTRDPLDRFMSALNMFYSPKNYNRRIQRMSHSKITNQKDINVIVDDIFQFPNHHFNPISNFLDLSTPDLSRINFVSIELLDSFIKSELGLEISRRKNVASSYSFKANDLSGHSIKKIESYYAADSEFF